VLKLASIQRVHSTGQSWGQPATTANGTHLSAKWVTGHQLKGAGLRDADASCIQYGDCELFWFNVLFDTVK